MSKGPERAITQDDVKAAQYNLLISIYIQRWMEHSNSDTTDIRKFISI